MPVPLAQPRAVSEGIATLTPVQLGHVHSTPLGLVVNGEVTDAILPSDQGGAEPQTTPGAGVHGGESPGTQIAGHTHKHTNIYRGQIVS